MIISQAQNRSRPLKLDQGAALSSHALYVSLLIALAAALSFFVWMHQSLRLDEAQSIWQTSRSLGGVLDVVAKDVHVPVYFVLLHYWEVLLGTGESAIRLFSLVFFLLSIPAIFALSLEAYSPRVAYAAAFITALSPFLNWYGSEARMYSLLFLLSILSHLYFIRIWKRPGGRAWVGYAAITLIGVFTHLFFILLPAVQALFFFSKKEIFPPGSLRRLANIAGLVVVCIIGWFVYRHFVGAGLTNPLLKRPTSVDFFNVFSNFFIGFQSDRINTFYLSLWPLLVFIGFTFLARKRAHEPQTAYLLMVSFVPIALAFFVSIGFQPIFLSRYLIICLPSLYVLAVYYLASYRGAAADISLSTLSAAMIAMLAIQAVQPVSVKEDFRSAAQYVSAQSVPSDIFVVSAPLITYPVEYYYKGTARLTTFPRWDRYAKETSPQAYSDDALAKSMTDWAAVYSKMYLLLGYDQGYQEKVRLYMDKHYQRIYLQEFSPGLTLYVYKLRYL